MSAVAVGIVRAPFACKIPVDDNPQAIAPVQKGLMVGVDPRIEDGDADSRAVQPACVRAVCLTHCVSSGR